VCGLSACGLVERLLDLIFVDASPPWGRSFLFVILVLFAGASGGQDSGTVAIDGVIPCSAPALRLIRHAGRAVMP
jgi:hypothetical protein